MSESEGCRHLFVAPGRFPCSLDTLTSGPAWPSQREAWSQRAAWPNQGGGDYAASEDGASGEEGEEQSEEESLEEMPPMVEAPHVMTPKERLRERRLHRKAQEEALAVQKEHRGREMLHRRLFQMGEANDWAAARGLKTQYCVHKNGDGSLCCHTYEDGEFSKQTSMDFFDRRYKVLRAEFQDAKCRGKCRLSPSGSTPSGGAADLGMQARSPPWLSDEQQKSRCAEVRTAAAEVRRLAAEMQRQRKVLQRVQPALMPFAVVG